MSEIVIKGMKELFVELNKLPLKIEKNIMRAALRAGASVVAVEAKKNVVVVSGELAKTIRTSSNAKRGLVEANAVVGSTSKTKDGKIRKKGWYATFVEFGTAAHPITAKEGKRLTFKTSDGVWHSLQSVMHMGAVAKPYMRPAFDTKSEEAVYVVAKVIRERLTKEKINQVAPERASI